jgi:two-component system NtrC family response regulator
MGGARILVIEPAERVRETFAMSLRARGFEVVTAASHATVGVVLMTFTPDAVLARVDAAADGSSVLDALRARWCDAAVVALVNPDRVHLAVDAMRAGADTYVTAPVDGSVAAIVLEKALESRRMRRDAGALRDEVRRRHRLVGDAPEIRAAQEIIHRAAPTTAAMLVVGEPGTGRVLVAQSVHEASPRRDHAFVRVPCAGVSEALLETELFGCEQGALGCAEARLEGALHAAHGGTLYLEEVEHLPPALQVKLLRVIQSGQLERVGSSEIEHVDVRVVASSSQDLAEAVSAGHFRDDLYYRLNVVAVTLPPLRQRKGDIPALIEHFLAVATPAQRKGVRTVSPGALSALFAYAWPGNVRELQRVVEWAVGACGGTEILADHLPPVLHGSIGDGRAGSALIPGATLFEIEREAILRTLDEVGGSTVRAAHVLGISVRKIQYRLKEYRRGHLTDARARSGPVLSRAANG